VSERILVIDDDDGLVAMLAEYLGGAGFAVEARPDARSGLERAARGDVGAVVLDVMLPDGDGFDLCRRIRASSDVPILMLTARGDEMDRVVGLELGADDYLPKPFNPRELLARLRAILRRRAAGAVRPGAANVLRFGRLEIDRDARAVRVGGEERVLTSYQFDLLVALAERAGRVLSRDALLQLVRGENLEAFDRSIDVHVSRIRAAIEDDPKRPRRILTLRGAGYVFAKRQDDEPAP
jgi:DNA-binding response OmpR family regulator